MNSARYFFDDGKSRKFWEYKLRSKSVTLGHGRIGSTGRKTTKAFLSAAAAMAEIAKLVAQKIELGYIKTEPARLKITRAKGTKNATETQVAKLEKQLQAKLPLEYRNFLLTQNGGATEPRYVCIPGHPYIANVSVGYLMGLYVRSTPDQSLLYAVEHIMPRMPKGQLPIAGDGDLFTLSLTRNPGCIYFWDHEAPDCDDEDADGKVQWKMSHATLLAGSFDEFLTRIAVYSNDD